MLLTHPRTADQDALTALLTAAGVESFHLPLLAVVASDYGQSLDQIAAIKANDVLVFTSKNGVQHFADCCKKLQLSFAQNEVYALGAKTAGAARNYGFSVAFVGSGASSKIFAEEIIRRDAGRLSAKRYVLLRGESASNELPQLLVSNSCIIEKIIVYRALKLDLNTDERNQLRNWLLSTLSAKLVVFTSSLVAETFFRHLQQESLISALPTIDVAVLGSTTREYVVGFGIEKIFMPKQATLEDLSSLVIGLVKRS